MPDQNGTGAVEQGEKVDLPEKHAKKARTFSSGSSGPPAAVKFRLKSDMKVCVAFDYMRVKVKDMWKMEKFTPALLELFAEEDKASANDGVKDGASVNGEGQKKQKQKAKNS